jgi:hypothetical protein
MASFAPTLEPAGLIITNTFASSGLPVASGLRAIPDSQIVRAVSQRSQYP